MVKVSGGTIYRFSFTQGLKQTDGLTPVLFYLPHKKIPLYITKYAQKIGYAADLNIIGRSLLYMKEVFNSIEANPKDTVLKFNEYKMKCMSQRRKVEGANAYLDSILPSNNDQRMEVKKRIASRNKLYNFLTPLFKLKDKQMKDCMDRHSRRKSIRE